MSEPEPEPIEPNHCVQLMANVMNYLSVSLYEGSFKKCHEYALRDLNSIYDTVADDPDYTRYKRELSRFTKS